MLHSFDPTSASRFCVALSDELTDEELMQSVQQGDEKALALLGRRHRGLVRTIISRLINNDADVDDLEQECLLEVWRHAANYDAAKGNALSWIITLVRRRSIDRIRRKASYSRAQERLIEEAKVITDFHAGADEEVAQADCGQLLAELIERLPEAQQEVIRLTFYRQMSQRQIAAHTGIALGTIKTRLELAMRKLRAAVAAHGELHEEMLRAA